VLNKGKRIWRSIGSNQDALPAHFWELTEKESQRLTDSVP
jgi:hypothetical protein